LYRLIHHQSLDTVVALELYESSHNLVVQRQLLMLSVVQTRSLGCVL